MKLNGPSPKNFPNCFSLGLAKMVDIPRSEYVATGWNGLKCVFIKVISYAHQEVSTQNGQVLIP